jgi:hypothetical protein
MGSKRDTGFQVLTTVVMKSCPLIVNRRFTGTINGLHGVIYDKIEFFGDSFVHLLFLASFLLDLLLGREDVGSMLLRNVGGLILG